MIRFLGKALLLLAFTLSVISGCSVRSSQASKATAVQSEYMLASPDRKIAVQFRVTDEKRAYYSISRNDTLVLQDSKLGLFMQDADFAQGLELIAASGVEIVEDNYELLTAKRRKNFYKANRQTFH